MEDIVGGGLNWLAADCGTATHHNFVWRFCLFVVLLLYCYNIVIVYAKQHNAQKRTQKSGKLQRKRWGGHNSAISPSPPFHAKSILISRQQLELLSDGWLYGGRGRS
jgi:hypothetical protein